MGQIRTVCVYCGSSPGNDPAFVAAATRFGEILAENGIGLVYGGGAGGLMGALASAALARGGDIIGVIPKFLIERERMFRGAAELVLTTDMHERKRIMFERSDAFVALPGGLGTLEELVEQLTWAQLGRHTKPIVLVNIDGFWAPLLQLLRHMHEAAFIRPEMDVRFATVDSADEVIPTIRAAARAQREDFSTAVREKF